MLGLMKDLVGLLNQLSFSTLTFQLIDLYQEVLIYNYIELKHPRIGLINIKNKIIFFYGVMLVITILQKSIPEKFKKSTKKLLKNYSGIKFPVKEKDFHKIEIKNTICINVFSYKNGLLFPNLSF